ncbi:hypothetical protein MtrunA17_Chr4g0043631 [Medicago truncatula]|uniref:Uncharacterized protein n=1 Tax=Medicago truncatula TaxID=3880 RepID=A0A396I901_MEDTR|nr:hypothetical protein MtrunA17_Chr4g0043631 [Medicago truncatula]
MIEWNNKEEEGEEGKAEICEEKNKKEEEQQTCRFGMNLLC